MVNHANLPFFFAVFPVLGSLITLKARNMNSTTPETLVLVFGTHSTSDVTFAMCRVGRKIKGLRVNSRLLWNKI